MKRVVSMLTILCIVVALSFVLVPSAAATPVTEKPEVAKNVTSSRFLNMLNHNYVYGDSFNYTDSIVNDSIIALLDSAEGEFINEAYISDYVENMYGITIVDFGSLNAEFPQKDGYVYIVPRGFDSYTHSLLDCRENEDGSFTVKTNVVIETHDGETEKTTATTMFVKNESSDFGYNILYSNIADDSSDA